jgi:hypothetical protein
MKPDPLFYIERAENNVAGPYDLVQMAGLLRKKVITPDTSTRLEGEDDWKPFGWRPQFIVAREMSPAAVSIRAEALDEAAAVALSPLPLPSRETVMKLVGMVLAAIVTGAGAYVLARLDVTIGTCLLYAAAGAVLVAQCMIFMRLMDEGFWTLILFFFVPFGDIFYFICNIWEYFTWFSVKYVGLAVLAGASIGLAAHPAH